MEDGSLERAIQIAAEAHAGQVDKGGAPYILHPLRVMMSLTGEVPQIVAVLHDLVEDSPAWTCARLFSEGFSSEVVMAVDSLTKRPWESYSEFIERVKLNPLATRVKLADLADNSDLSRIREPTEADHARLEKYKRARERLTA